MAPTLRNMDRLFYTQGGSMKRLMTLLAAATLAGTSGIAAAQSKEIRIAHVYDKKIGRAHV